MSNQITILILQNKNKILFQRGLSHKYELPILQKEVSMDGIGELIQTEYGVEVLDCEKVLQNATPVHRIIHAHVKGPESVVSLEKKWFTLTTAANNLVSISPYDTIREFLTHQAELSRIQLQFGLRDGSVVAIGEISSDERGLKCGCVCPVCGTPLQARIGTGKKQPHFAHNSIDGCDVVAAQQTALHLMAKDIIADAHGIYLPALSVTRQEVFTSNENEDRTVVQQLPSAVEYRPAGFFRCGNVNLEKKISDIVPDIILEQNENQVLVEVAVTHFIDDEKQKKIEEIGLPVLEVDLSGLRTDQLNREEIRRYLLETDEGKTWKYVPKTSKYQVAYNKFKELYDEKQNELLKKKEEERQKEQQRKEKRKNAQEKYNLLMSPYRYKNRLMKYRDDQAALGKIQEFCRFYKQESPPSVPFFLDIPTTGEVVFLCDRRIWQAAIFDHFIYDRNTQKAEPTIAHVKKISSWVIKYQKMFSLDWDLMTPIFVTINGQGYYRSLLEQSIKEFLDYMACLGFISARSRSIRNIYTSMMFQSRQNLRIMLIIRRFCLFWSKNGG